MKSLSTRTRIIILSSVVTVFFLFIQEIDFRIITNINFPFDPWKPLILGLIIYVGTFWVLFFKVKGERLLTILLFPAINIFALTLFSELIVDNVLNGVEQFGAIFISIIIFWGYTYISLLIANILNTAHLADIPLEQAAKAAQFVLTLITAYIMFFILFSNDIFIILKIGIVVLLAFLSSYNSLWTIDLKARQRFTASLIIALLMCFASMIISIWPISAPYIALILTLLFYIFLGISLEIREIISSSVWIEYNVLFLLILVLIILVAEWGINGTVI
ncbi:MAG: hypothetical protein WCJ58_02370 [bacterium]